MNKHIVTITAVDKDYRPYTECFSAEYVTINAETGIEAYDIIKGKREDVDRDIINNYDRVIDLSIDGVSRNRELLLNSVISFDKMDSLIEICIADKTYAELKAERTIREFSNRDDQKIIDNLAERLKDFISVDELAGLLGLEQADDYIEN